MKEDPHSMHKGCYASLTAAPEPGTIISIDFLFKGFSGGVWASGFSWEGPYSYQLCIRCAAKFKNNDLRYRVLDARDLKPFLTPLGRIWSVTELGITS